MGRYEEDPAWADVTPIPQDEGSSHPLAAIAYADDYTEAMSYLRAVMAANELSPRTLALTEDIIDINAAHYTVWLYRAKILAALGADLHAELRWTNTTALAHLKNYQIWHHRHTIVEALAVQAEATADKEERENALAQLLDGEARFVDEMFERDAKNYHVWSYRQWYVRRFALWDSVSELHAVEALLDEDVRNNSAWNHRWAVVFRGPNAPHDLDREADLLVWDREMDYVEEKISLAPQNQSPWSYLRGLLKQFGQPLSKAKDVATVYANLHKPDGVESSHALDLIADIAKEEKQTEVAAQAFDLLATKYDPIRSRYWMWKKGNLATAAA